MLVQPCARLEDWPSVCVCVSDSIRLPMINPLPLCWAGEFCRFITAGPAGPERITQGREENDHSLSNTQEGCQDSCCRLAHTHTHIHTHTDYTHSFSDFFSIYCLQFPNYPLSSLFSTVSSFLCVPVFLLFYPVPSSIYYHYMYQSLKVCLRPPHAQAHTPHTPIYCKVSVCTVKNFKSIPDCTKKIQWEF